MVGSFRKQSEPIYFTTYLLFWKKKIYKPGPAKHPSLTDAIGKVAMCKKTEKDRVQILWVFTVMVRN